jgi:acyl dehydratase
MNLYLEDFVVGQRFASGSVTVTADDIIAFSRQFDPQPFHVDPDAARNTFFAGLAASGWHTAALTMRLNVEGGLPFGGGIIGAGGEIVWPIPMRPNDTIHVESEILEIRPSRSRPDRGIVTTEIRTLNQRGETVQIFTVKIVAFRKSASWGPAGNARAQHEG